MRAGWKLRIDERRYFEEKKKRDIQIVMQKIEAEHRRQYREMEDEFHRILKGDNDRAPKI